MEYASGISHLSLIIRTAYVIYMIISQGNITETTKQSKRYSLSEIIPHQESDILLLKWPSWSVNFESLVISCVGLREEEPQTAHLMSFRWASHIVASMLTGH